MITQASDIINAPPVAWPIAGHIEDRHSRQDANDWALRVVALRDDEGPVGASRLGRARADPGTKARA
jgi:hypothetical protein